MAKKKTLSMRFLGSLRSRNQHRDVRVDYFLFYAVISRAFCSVS